MNDVFGRTFAVAVAATGFFAAIISSPTPSAAQGMEKANSLTTQANQFYKKGQHKEASPLFEQSLAIRERVRGPNHPDVANALNNLALSYYNEGRYAEAEPLFVRAVAIYDKLTRPDQNDVLATLGNLGNLYDRQERLSEAEQILRRALAIVEKAFGANHANVANALSNLAMHYYNRDRYADAEPLFKRALGIYEKVSGPSHADVGNTLNNLGALYDAQKRYNEAEPLLKRSLVITEKTSGSAHPYVADTLSLLGGLYRVTGRYAEAEPLLKRGLDIREKALGSEHPYVAGSLSSIALLSVNQNRLGEAEPLYKRALTITEKVVGPNHRDTADLLNDLTELYGKQGRFSDAMPIIGRTIASRQATTGLVLPVLMGAEKANVIDRSKSFADSYNILQFTSSSAAAEAVNKLAQRYAAGTGELATLVRRDQDLGAEYDKADKAIVTAVANAPKDRNAASEEAMRRRLAQIKTERDQIQAVLSQKFPDYVALANPQPLTLQETQRLLADDEAVVAFNIGEKTSYAWTITKSDSFWAELPTTAKALNPQIQKLRESLTFNINKPFDVAASHKLYKDVFAPIARSVADKKRLSIVTNGALTSIPFGILIASDPSGTSMREADWLINSFALTIIPSVYSLKTMRAQRVTSKASKPMIAFADPVFSRAARTQSQGQQIAMRSLTSFYQGSDLNIKALGEMLPQLDGTRKEVQAIGRELSVDSRDIKFGIEATETSVKRAPLEDYRIVYFATHGLVSGELAKFTKAKAEPALALTIPDNPTELDDGLLQASEISKLALNADWVVLSACNTASGDSVGAEALSGLARGFLYAGARSLVVSHWDVDDEATAALMSSLFDIANNQPALSHGEALQQAMLKKLSAARTDSDAHPRLWAPFVVVGEPAKPQ